jgi:hypothetical protein
MLTRIGWRRTANVGWPSRSAPATASDRSVWVFLAPGRFAAKTPAKMSVGLSWNSLDSLVRIETFQWVTRLEAGKIFSRAFSLALRGAGTGAQWSRPCGSAGLFMGKLNSFSDFLQQIVVRAVAFGRLNPKAARHSRPSRSAPRRQGPTNCRSAGSLPSETLSATLFATMG